MPLLTLTQAAAVLGVNPETLRRRIKRGQLPLERDDAGRYLVEVPEGANVDASMPEVGQSTQEASQASTHRVEELEERVTWLQGVLERAEEERRELRVLLLRQSEQLTRLLPAPAEPHGREAPVAGARQGETQSMQSERSRWWTIRDEKRNLGAGLTLTGIASVVVGIILHFALRAHVVETVVHLGYIVGLVGLILFLIGLVLVY